MHEKVMLHFVRDMKNDGSRPQLRTSWMVCQW